MHSALLVISELKSLQSLTPPLKIYTPRIPNTSKKSRIINITFISDGIDRSSELTTVLMPKENYDV